MKKEFTAATSWNRAMHVSVFEGVFSACALALGDAFFPTFALQAQATDSQLASLVYCTAIAGAIAQLSSGYLVTLIGSRKRLLVVGAALQSLLYLPLAVASFLSAETPMMIVICATISASLGSLVAPPWNSWMNDVVTGASRGRYFGWRSLICGLSSTAAMSVGAAVLYLIGAPSYVWLFSAATATRIVSCVLLVLQPEPNTQRSKSKVHSTDTKSPLLQVLPRSVLMLAAAGTLSTLSGGLAQPYYAPFAAVTLNLGPDMFAVSAAVQSFAKLLANPLWGTANDNLGPLRALRVGLVAVALSSLGWVLGCVNLWTLLCVQVATGFAQSGIDLLVFTSTLDVTHGDTALIGKLNAAQAIASAIGSLLGSAILGMSTSNSYTTVFLVASALRVVVASAFFFLDLRQNTRPPSAETQILINGHTKKAYGSDQ